MAIIARSKYEESRKGGLGVTFFYFVAFCTTGCPHYNKHKLLALEQRRHKPSYFVGLNVWYRIL
jgi:hypothetical protein